MGNVPLKDLFWNLTESNIEFDSLTQWFGIGQLDQWLSANKDLNFSLLIKNLYNMASEGLEYNTPKSYGLLL